MQAVHDLIDQVKSLLTYKKKTRVDNPVFVLHKVTSGVLFILSLVVSTAVFVKNPVSCVADSSIERIVDVYCWIHASYTLPDRLFNETEVLVAHPGVASKSEGDYVHMHKYYQWVGFVLFFQGLAFLLPRVIWKGWEGGRLSSYIANLENDLVQNPSEQAEARQRISDHFVDAIGHNDEYSMKFAFCELLNFVNVVVQIILTDSFLGGILSKYGFKLIQFTRESPLKRTDPLAIAFPTVTKCTLNTYGPSGNIINYDALCVLPFNIYNEKFYPILWFWFIILSVLSGIAVIHRVLTFLFQDFRLHLLKRKFHFSKEMENVVYDVNKELHYGDWFILYQMGKNMGTHTFLEFLNDIKEKLPTYSFNPNFRSIKKKL